MSGAVPASILMTPTEPPSPPLARIPPDILCAQDYEALAPRFIAPGAHAYIAGGSGDESTLRANLEAFASVRILPRLLRELTTGHTRLELFGRRLRHPIVLAPLAFQTLAHPHGELDTARAAQATDSCLVASTLSAFPLEEIARHNRGENWFQLYFQPLREATLDLVRRAEAAGYAAIVVTLDAAVQSPSRRALRAGFRLPPDLAPANLRAHPRPAQVTLPAGQSLIFQGLMREAPTWADLDWLLAQTRLPVLVKGVLRADDAGALKARGVAGLIVSNHGGRSLDGVPASLAALPRIRAAVGPDYPLLLDSGIRSGTDVFRAIALGADAVLVGRLQAYALAVAGALGVAHMLKLLREELELCMALSGCVTLADIDADAVAFPASLESPC